MRLLLILLALIGVSQLHAQSSSVPFNADSLKKSSETIKETNCQRMAKAVIRHFVIKADSSTYGYSIYIDGQLYIHQTTIPAMPGKKGFARIDQAEKTALLVIEKIKQGELPPTITEDDMRKRKIIQ